MLTTIKAKIYMDPESLAVIHGVMRSATEVYNLLVPYLSGNPQLARNTDQCRAVLNRALKELAPYPCTKAYFSQSVQATRDEVIWAFRRYLTAESKDDMSQKPPGLRDNMRLSVVTYYGQTGFKLAGDKLQLSLGTGRADGRKAVLVTLGLRPDIPSFQRIRVLRLVPNRSGRLEVHLVVEVEPKRSPGTGRVAIDLGENQAIAAVFEEGHPALLYSGRFVKAVRRNWNKVRKRLKGTSRRFNQVRQQESRQTQHLLNIMSHDFIRRCQMLGVGTIAIGDLRGIPRGKSKGKVLNQRLGSWAFRRLCEMLTHKAELVGIKVIEVSEKFTSIMCHRCGFVNKASRPRRGEFACRCGWAMHSDVNAAANIFHRAFQVSPFMGSSGKLAVPVVVPVRLDWHKVYEV